MSRRTKVRQIALVVGEPGPKRAPKHHGGPQVSLQLRDNQQVSLSVEALDAEGNEAAATTAWSSSDESIVSVTDTANGNALAVASPGAAGLGTATITATVTDDSDGDTHTGTLEVVVVAGDAVVVNVLAGDPEDKPV